MSERTLRSREETFEEIGGKLIPALADGLIWYGDEKNAVNRLSSQSISAKINRRYDEWEDERTHTKKVTNAMKYLQDKGAVERHVVDTPGWREVYWDGSSLNRQELARYHKSI